MDMQKLIYPQKYVNITQGSYGKFSHSTKPAIDIAGGNKNANNVYSCGDGVNIYDETKYQSNSRFKFESIITPLGKIYPSLVGYYYHSMAFEKYRKGAKVKQGDYIMNEGNNSEPPGFTTGDIIHFELWDYIDRKYPISVGSKVIPEEVLFLKRGYHIFVKNNSKYPLYWLADEKDDEKLQIKVDKLQTKISKSNTKKSDLLGYAEQGYYNILQTKEIKGIKWYKIYKDMWIEKVYGVDIVKKDELKHIGNTLEGKKIYIEV